MRYLAGLLLLSSTSSAQEFVIGAVGGWRTTNDVTYAAISESKRYVVGSMIEVGLPLNLAAEFDALYHRSGFEFSSGCCEGYTETEAANTWEFPIVLKYRIPLRRIRPFAEAGVAPQTMSGRISTVGSFFNNVGTVTTYSSTEPTNWSAAVGVVIGGGVRFDAGRLTFSPQVRYTHWTSTQIILPGNNGPSGSSSQEQFEVLIGIGGIVHRSNR